MEICGICGGSHCHMDCDIIQISSHIPDKIIPSKAKLTLPEDLELIKMADNSYSVVAAYVIPKGTQFGPLQAKKLCSLLPTISFPLRVFCETEENLSEYYLDVSDENECNWMMFVNPASDFQEQNIICYQDSEDIYYVTVKDICEGEPLKVWYSPYYATKMQKDVLKPAPKEYVEESKENENIDTLVRKKKNITSREVWSCKFCGKIERNLSEFASHLLKHYYTKLGRKCQICNASFISIASHKKHMRIVHGPTKNKPLEPSKSNSNEIQGAQLTDSLPEESSIGGPLLLNEFFDNSMDITSLVLPQLDLKSIEDQNNLFENDNVNLNVDSILPDSVKELDNFNFELLENDNEQFVCDICLKSFSKLKHLVLHMNIHTGKYACFDCNKVFARLENLNYHACKIFYKLQCPHCSRLFFQKKYLRTHIKNKHNKQNKLQQSSTSKKSPKIFSCTDCSKSFTHKNNLLIHSKAHQTREKFTCPICNKVLSSEKTYQKHYKLHEGNIHKCELCQKVYSRKDALKYHMDHTHSANMEICGICKKAIKSKKLLKLHMDLHELQENTFKCSLCPSTFKQQRYLNRHMKFNHEMKKGIQSFLSNIDKQYSCPKCDKKVKLSKSLKDHIRKVHPEENIEYKNLELMKTKYKRSTNFAKQVDDSVMDLKQTIENMNYSTDEINHEITFEIDKLLNNPENFGSESNDRLVENLINTAVGEVNLGNSTQQNDPMLSMPDLDIGDDIN